MLMEIGSMDEVPAFIDSVKSGKGGRLQGFGHRVYKSYDPRAKIIKRTADEVFEVTGKNPLLDIALKLEEIALSDEYFTSRRLYPNVDFYSGLIYQAMGFPLAMFPVLFAIPRTVGLAGALAGAARPGQQARQAPPALHRGRRRATTCRWTIAGSDRLGLGDLDEAHQAFLHHRHHQVPVARRTGIPARAPARRKRSGCPCRRAATRRP